MKKYLLEVSALVFLTGCNGIMLKSTVLEKAKPIDDVMILLKDLPCGDISDLQVMAKCEQVKMAASLAHDALKELGVNPSK